MSGWGGVSKQRDVTQRLQYGETDGRGSNRPQLSGRCVFVCQRGLLTARERGGREKFKKKE